MIAGINRIIRINYMTDNNTTGSTWGNLKRLLGIMKPVRLWIALTIFSSIFSGLSAILLAKGIKGMTDAALAHQLRTLMNFLYLVLIALVFDVSTSILRSYASGRFSNFGVTELMNRSQERIACLPLSYLDNHKTGDLMSRLTNDIREISMFIGNSIIQLVSNLIIFIVAISYLFVLNWKLTMFSGVLTPLFTMIVMKMSKNIENQSRKQQESLGKESNILQDSIMGLTEIKSFSLNRIMYNKYCKEVDQTTVNTNRMYLAELKIQPIGFVCRSLPFIATMFYGGYLVINHSLTYGGLLAYISLCNNIVDPIGNMPKYITSVRAAMAPIKRVFEIWDTPVERDEGMVFQANPGTGVPVISLDHVVFSYNPESELFRDLSFDIKAGETVALVGASGCGKSTVLRLITDFYQPRSGSIRLYGHSIAEWSPEGLRALMSEVLQDNYLFPDTIYQNIIYGQPDASIIEVENASKSADIYDFIQGLPEKFDTMVGERGIKLSGGQRQRVAIARALLKDAPILLLDEATSALDTESEREVQQALDKLMVGRTTLVIAHRLSTIINADRILVMDEGRIVETGTHEELIKNGGVYKQLYNKQFAADRSGTAGAEGQVGFFDKA